MSYRKNGKGITVNEGFGCYPDLNQHPFMSRDILKKHNINLALLSTSRGCKRNCAFCCSNSMWSGLWRGRDSKVIVDEIEMLVKDYKCNRFLFIDNSFEDPANSFTRGLSIAHEIINRNLNISYGINCRANINRVTDETTIAVLKKSGLCNVFLGIESANATDLKLYGKGISVQDSSQAIEYFRNHEIDVEIDFINFNPYSTYDGLYQNIDFLERYRFVNCFPNLRLLRLYRGTRIYDQVRKDGLMTEGKYYDVINYKFVDERIMQLTQFLNEYFAELNRKHNLDFMFQFYSRYFEARIGQFKNLFMNTHDEKAYQLVATKEIEIDALLNKFNAQNANWFRKILNLYVHQPCKDNDISNRARQLTEDELSTEDMLATLSRLGRLKN